MILAKSFLNHDFAWFAETVLHRMEQYFEGSEFNNRLYDMSQLGVVDDGYVELVRSHDLSVIERAILVLSLVSTNQH